MVSRPQGLPSFPPNWEGHAPVHIRGVVYGVRVGAAFLFCQDLANHPHQPAWMGSDIGRLDGEVIVISIEHGISIA